MIGFRFRFPAPTPLLNVVKNMSQISPREVRKNERRNKMIGAIVGDIVGSRFEWHNRKSKQFTLLKEAHESRHPCRFTDDSVMRLAVADAIMKWREACGVALDELVTETVMSLQEFGRFYSHAGYGGAFRHWLGSANPKPYNSWGNGAAMRVSACGWAGRTLDGATGSDLIATVNCHSSGSL